MIYCVRHFCPSLDGVGRRPGANVVAIPEVKQRSNFRAKSILLRSAFITLYKAIYLMFESC